MPLEIVPFDLSSTVEQVLRALAIQASERNVELVYRLTPSVPRHVVGDPTRLRQILMNLLGNAIKFTSNGHALLCIEQLGSGTETVTRFTVEDTKKLFPRFIPYVKGTESMEKKFWLCMERYDETQIEGASS